MNPGSLFGGLAFSLFASLSLATAPSAQGQVLLWTVGQDDNGWPMGTAGGADASFVQENGTQTPLPGSPFSTSTPSGADNDYYFAGTYTKVIAGNGQYDPVGVVDVNEEAAERAFAGGDLELRYHFNLPTTLKPDSLLSVTFDVFNLDTSGSDPRFGVEVYFNGVLVQPQVVVRPAQIDTDYTTPQFTLSSVNAEVGPGADNIVSLKGTSYNSDGGGAWMGLDYVRLNEETQRVPAPTFPWSVGQADGSWPAGTGGGTNAAFVEGNGSVNALPGSPTSTAAAGKADNDYYFAGLYTNAIAGNGTYTPVGLVANHEVAAERGFKDSENELRVHFNLPNTLQPSDLLAVTFAGINLDTAGSDPRYGVEVYFNGVRVMTESLIRAAQLGKPITTPQFTLASVNAAVGAGADNIVTLRGISHSADGGGNALGIDYIQLNPVLKPIPPAVVPWSVGLNDNAQPSGNGGGPNTSFVQENGEVNPLPGIPNSPEVDRQADNDYYFAGSYTTVIAGNGTYTPVGDVRANEEAAERAFAGNDTELRYHFNLPTTLGPNSQLSVSFDALSLQGDAPDPRWGVQVYFNNVLVAPERVIRNEDLNKTFSTEPFTLSKVNAQVGPGYDNIVTLKGISYNADGGGNWMGFDYIQLNPVVPPPFPWSVGMDDNGWPVGDGGGATTTFVQEAGSNELPGNPSSPEINGQADDDYYFAGEYTKAIASNGDYTPVGTVLVNEEAAERAFAGSDNTKRYHFNLPSTLKPTDQLMVTFDANNLDTSGADPQYGVEIYFNNVLVQSEILIKPDTLDVDYTTTPFTLATVGAQVGPGYDNIVTLKGINHSADGGGAWMGIDYVNLDPMPTPVFPWAVGKKDNAWPLTGSGGGENTVFVQENGSINDLPGNAHSPKVNQKSDNDYYFAGSYTKAIAANGSYTPLGVVPRNEEAAERAFAGADNDLRYHFNLPSTLKLSDQVTVTFDALNLDTSVETPRYGIEVYFNNVLVQPQIVIGTNELGVAYTTKPFTLSSVGAQLGLGPDNIVSLRGINYSADGGGNWMGIDSVALQSASDSVPLKFLAPTTAAGKLTLSWTGTGSLEWAPAVTGPWTGITPAPTSPYVEDVQSKLPSRFYRLKK